MKRLILLFLVLVPFALWEHSRSEHRARAALEFRPRTGRLARLERVSDPSPKYVDLVGFPKATAEHAHDEAIRKVRDHLANWLEPYGVPKTWHAPTPLVEQMAEVKPVETIEKDYGEGNVVYIQPVRLDTSDRQRDRLIQAYEHELAGRRLSLLVEVLAFVLMCLGVVASYIRADEATKGYYTNYLRVAAVGGLGAAAAILYQLSH